MCIRDRPPTVPESPVAPAGLSRPPNNPASPLEVSRPDSTAPIVPKLRPAEPASKQPDPAQAKVQPTPETSAATDKSSTQVGSNPDTSAAKSETQRSIAHLLPPVFDVLDPTRMAVGKGKENFKVFLPDGKGGTAQIDNRILRVKHGEKEVSLVSLNDKQRARQRLVQNVIAIVIGIVVIALAFTLLM